MEGDFFVLFSVLLLVCCYSDKCEGWGSPISPETGENGVGRKRFIFLCLHCHPPHSLPANGFLQQPPPQVTLLAETTPCTEGRGGDLLVWNETNSNKTEKKTGNPRNKAEYETGNKIIFILFIPEYPEQRFSQPHSVPGYGHAVDPTMGRWTVR